MLETRQAVCCGVLELYGFPDIDTGCDCEECVAMRKSAGSPKQFAKLENEIPAAIKRARSLKYAHVFATLITTQNTLFGPTLKKCGFKMVGRAINDNTGNMVYMYVLTRPLESKRKPRKGEWNY